MKKCVILLLLGVLLLTGCQTEVPEASQENKKEAVYLNITAQEAKEIMDTQEGYIILDVRTQEEYDEGHIPGAMLIPND